MPGPGFFLFSFYLSTGQGPQIHPISAQRPGFEQPRRGEDSGHLHRFHDHRAILQEVPILCLPLSDDPVGSGTERLQIKLAGCRDRVGQGKDPEHVAREPVRRETGWAMTGNSSQGDSRTGASTLGGVYTCCSRLLQTDPSFAALQVCQHGH